MPPSNIDTPHSLKWHLSSASCTEFYSLKCQVSVLSLYFYRGKNFLLMALLTRRLSHPGLIRHRSEGNSSPKYFNCTSRSQHFPHNGPSQTEQLISHHTFRALLPLHFRLTISTTETLPRLCWCFHTATNFHIKFHLHRSPSQRSRNSIPRRRRPLPSLLHENRRAAPCRRPPRRQRYL